MSAGRACFLLRSKLAKAVGPARWERFGPADALVCDMESSDDSAERPLLVCMHLGKCGGQLRI